MYQSVKQYKIYRCIEFKLKRFFHKSIDFQITETPYQNNNIGYASILLCPISLDIIQCLSIYIYWWCLEFIHSMEAYNIFCLWSSNHKSESDACIKFLCAFVLCTLWHIHITHKARNAFIVLSIIIKVLMMFHYSLFGILYKELSLWYYLSMHCLACTSRWISLFKIYSDFTSDKLII